MGGIVVKGVWKSFGGSPVLKGVSLSVSGGEVVALLGPNGSGKSTLLRIVSGVLSPDRGEVVVDGVDVVREPLKARRVVGYAPEEPVLFESLGVREFLEFMLSVYGVRVDRDAAARVLSVLGLEGEVGKLVGELSRGNRRRLLLAVLMLRDPGVLVLDEVFTGLDPACARLVKA